MTTNDPLGIDSLIDASLISLDVSCGSTPAQVIEYLVHLVSARDRVTDLDLVRQAALDREKSSPTGLPGGAAIPHCRSSAWKKSTLVFVRLSSPVDFGGPDGPSELVFFIGVPTAKSDQHTTILSAIARGLLKKSFTAGLRGAESSDEALEIIKAHLAAAQRKSPRTHVEQKPATENRDASARPVHLIAITACPTGIAHTYLAADALGSVATTRTDLTLKVETQGAAGIRAVSDADCARAEALICAADIGVSGLSRFEGIPTLKVPISRAVNDPKSVIDEAVALAKDARKKASASDSTKAQGTNSVTDDSDNETSKSRTHQPSLSVREAVMTGVSFMIPFVAASGLLMALGFLLGGHQISAVADSVVADWSVWNLPANAIVTVSGAPIAIDAHPLLVYAAAVCFAIGMHGMQAIVAILSAFIAFGLSGRPGIAPGFVGGAISVSVGAGFIGGLVTGIIAGLVVAGLVRLRVPQWLSGLMPVVVIPLLGSLSVGIIMYVFLGVPLAKLLSGLQSWLAGMDPASSLALGALLGVMMCADMGGPINKAAYLFATAGLSTGDEASMKIMAAVMAAGMVPPLATSLAALLRPQRFTLTERQNAKAGWLLGASFISEGAIPFAAKDPFRVIPSIMVGGAVAGAASMVFGAATRVPHGGLFVLFAITNPISWLLSIVCGTLVAAFSIVVLKRFGKNSQHLAVTSKQSSQSPQ